MYNHVCDISETDKLQHYCLLRVFYQKICFGTNEIYCLLSVRHAKAALVMYLAVKFTGFFLILCFFFRQEFYLLCTRLGRLHCIIMFDPVWNCLYHSNQCL